MVRPFSVTQMNLVFGKTSVCSSCVKRSPLNSFRFRKSNSRLKWEATKQIDSKPSPRRKSIGYAELIQQRGQVLPQEKQAEIFDFVEFIATRHQALQGPTDDQHKQRVLAALVAARMAWPAINAQQIGEMTTHLWC